MPLKSIPGGLIIPESQPFATTTPDYGSTLVLTNNSQHKIAIVFEVPRTGTLEKVEYRHGSVSLDSNNDIRVSFRGIDASGFPNSSPDQSYLYGSAAAANAWFAPGAMTRSVNRGDILCVMWEYNNFKSSDILTISTLNLTSGAQLANDLPYTLLHNGTSWAKQNPPLQPVLALKYTDGTNTWYEYARGCWPCSALTSSNYNSGTVIGSGGDERGLSFSLPFPAQLAGVWLRMGYSSSSATADITVYQGTNPITPPSPVTRDPDAGSALTGRPHVYWLPTPVTLAANVTYHIALKPTSTNDVTLYSFDVASAAIMNAVPGGQNWQYAFRADGGAWSTTATKRPWMGLILDQLSDGALGYIDVTLPPYNAKGNGSDDDTTAIQGAFTAAASASPGTTVFIPRGAAEYICQGLDFAGSNLRLTGDGTLKRPNPASAFEVLKISGNHNLVTGIRIDGNRPSTGGRGIGLNVVGNYNHVRDMEVFNTRTATDPVSGMNFYVQGDHNLLEGVWARDSGAAAFHNSGNYNRYVDVTATNWGIVGFYHVGTVIDRLDIDGGYFEPGSDSLDNDCIWFDGSTTSSNMVAIRNVVVNWSDTFTPSTTTPVLGRFTWIKRLILDNCLFKHKHTTSSALATVQIGVGVKRAYFDHVFMSRQLKLSSIDNDAVIMLLDTQIGDDQLWAGSNTQPDNSVVGVAGAQFIARASKFTGFKAAALQLIANLETGSMVHFEASDCDFDGYFASTTYDVGVSSPGALNYSRRILWLNNRRTNSASGGAADTAAGTDIPKLFTTRDWSKRVLQWGSYPTSTTEIKWQAGDTIMYPTPRSGGYIGTVCVTGGLTSVWKEFGLVL